MKRLATECLIPFEVSLIGSSVENIYKLLTLSPSKFEEITSTMIIPAYSFESNIYPISDWAFIKVIQNKFPDTKLNCIIVKKYNNKDDCIKSVTDSLARQMLNGPLYRPFLAVDDRYLKSDNLSQRKYADVLNCTRRTLAQPKVETKTQVDFSLEKAYDEPPF